MLHKLPSLFPWKHNKTKIMAESVLDDDAVQPGTLAPCDICGRTFLPGPLQKHNRICEKNASKKRKIFNSLKQRVEGTDLAMFHQQTYLKKPDAQPSKPEVANVANPWKEKHQQLVNAIRAAKGTPSEPVITPSRQRSMSMLNSTFERCPSCDRQFGPKAFDRHVEWCKERKTRLPQSPANVLQAKERLEARTKYRVPPMNRPKLTVKEKYQSPTKVEVIQTVKSTGNLDRRPSVRKTAPKASTPKKPEKHLEPIRAEAVIAVKSEKSIVSRRDRTPEIKQRKPELIKSSGKHGPPSMKINSTQVNNTVDGLTVSHLNTPVLAPKKLVTWGTIQRPSQSPATVPQRANNSLKFIKPLVKQRRRSEASLIPKMIHLKKPVAGNLLQINDICVDPCQSERSVVSASDEFEQSSSSTVRNDISGDIYLDVNTTTSKVMKEVGQYVYSIGTIDEISSESIEHTTKQLDVPLNDKRVQFQQFPEIEHTINPIINHMEDDDSIGIVVCTETFETQELLHSKDVLSLAYGDNNVDTSILERFKHICGTFENEPTLTEIHDGMSQVECESNDLSEYSDGQAHANLTFEHHTNTFKNDNHVQGLSFEHHITSFEDDVSDENVRQLTVEHYLIDEDNKKDELSLERHDYSIDHHLIEDDNNKDELLLEPHYYLTEDDNNKDELSLVRHDYSIGHNLIEDDNNKDELSLERHDYSIGHSLIEDDNKDELSPEPHDYSIDHYLIEDDNKKDEFSRERHDYSIEYNKKDALSIEDRGCLIEHDKERKTLSIGHPNYSIEHNNKRDEFSNVGHGYSKEQNDERTGISIEHYDSLIESDNKKHGLSIKDHNYSIEHNNIREELSNVGHGYSKQHNDKRTSLSIEDHDILIESDKKKHGLSIKDHNYSIEHNNIRDELSNAGHGYSKEHNDERTGLSIEDHDFLIESDNKRHGLSIKDYNYSIVHNNKRDKLSTEHHKYSIEHDNKRNELSSGHYNSSIEYDNKRDELSNANYSIGHNNETGLSIEDRDYLIESDNKRHGDHNYSILNDNKRDTLSTEHHKYSIEADNKSNELSSGHHNFSIPRDNKRDELSIEDHGYSIGHNNKSNGLLIEDSLIEYDNATEDDNYSIVHDNKIGKLSIEHHTYSMEHDNKHANISNELSIRHRNDSIEHDDNKMNVLSSGHRNDLIDHDNKRDTVAIEHDNKLNELSSGHRNDSIDHDNKRDTLAIEHDDNKMIELSSGHRNDSIEHDNKRDTLTIEHDDNKIIEFSSGHRNYSIEHDNQKVELLNEDHGCSIDQNNDSSIEENDFFMEYDNKRNELKVENYNYSIIHDNKRNKLSIEHHNYSIEHDNKRELEHENDGKHCIHSSLNVDEISLRCDELSFDHRISSSEHDNDSLDDDDKEHEINSIEHNQSLGGIDANISCNTIKTLESVSTNDSCNSFIAAKRRKLSNDDNYKKEESTRNEPSGSLDLIPQKLVDEDIHEKLRQVKLFLELDLLTESTVDNTTSNQSYKTNHSDPQETYSFDQLNSENIDIIIYEKIYRTESPVESLQGYYCDKHSTALSKSRLEREIRKCCSEIALNEANDQTIYSTYSETDLSNFHAMQYGRDAFRSCNGEQLEEPLIATGDCVLMQSSGALEDYPGTDHSGDGDVSPSSFSKRIYENCLNENIRKIKNRKFQSGGEQDIQVLPHNRLPRINTITEESHLSITIPKVSKTSKDSMNTAETERSTSCESTSRQFSPKFMGLVNNILSEDSSKTTPLTLTKSDCKRLIKLNPKKLPKLQLPKIETRKITVPVKELKCDKLILPAIEVSDCETINPFPSLAKTSRANRDSYNPFVTAERQLMELLECDDFKPFKPQSPVNKPVANIIPTSHTKVTLKSLTNNKNLKHKRASVIDPPTDFKDCSDLFDDNFELIENFINDNYNDDNLFKKLDLDTISLGSNKTVTVDDNTNDEFLIDPRLINEHDNLSIPEHLNVDDTSPVDSLQNIHTKYFNADIDKLPTLKPNNPHSQTELNDLINSIGNINMRDKKRPSSVANKSSQLTPSSYGRCGSPEKRRGNLSSLKNSMTILDPVKPKTLKSKEDVAQYFDEVERPSTKTPTRDTPQQEEPLGELFAVDDEMYEEYKRYEQMYLQSKEQEKMRTEQYEEESNVSKFNGDSAYGSLSRNKTKIRTQVAKLTPLEAPADSASSSGSETAVTPKPQKIKFSCVSKQTKFCHECGNKYPLASAKFCVECGVRRLVL